MCGCLCLERCCSIFVLLWLLIALISGGKMRGVGWVVVMVMDQYVVCGEVVICFSKEKKNKMEGGK